MDEQQYKNTVLGIRRFMKTKGIDYDCLSDLVDTAFQMRGENPEFDKKWWLSVTNFVKYESQNALAPYNRKKHTDKNLELLETILESALLFESPYLVDSFFTYIEIDKPMTRRFYAPRKRVLKPIVNAYQQVYDGELDFLSVSQPKRTGKSSSGFRLALMMAGREPEGSIFCTGAGATLVKSFYNGMNEIIDDPEMYKRFLDVFPLATFIDRSVETYEIHLKNKSRFATITCRPIDGAVVGSTEANVLSYLDDCVRNKEEASNRDRLEFLNEKITGDILGRRLEGTPIVIQGTKYSLYDPISFLQSKADEMGWKWKEVAIPALDPVTDESNWEITVKGKKMFTTAYYRRERKLVPADTWMAEFQQTPIERKGRLFPEERINTFIELPIDVEPDTIIAACDTADSGADRCAMPIAYVYGNDVYIKDVVYDSSGPEHTKPKCANKLVQYNVKKVTFESNGAGKYFGRDVMEMVAEKGGRTSAKFKYNTSNKVTRIENASDTILKSYYFLDKSKYAPDSEYALFIRELVTLTRTGKMVHDDAADSLALLENEMRQSTIKAEAVFNPFRGIGDRLW